MDSDDSDYMVCTADLLKEETAATLPAKSKQKYLNEYILFKKWCEEAKRKQISENEVLAYFIEKSNALKPPSLWAKFSMLKTTLAIKDNIDIKYPKLIAFLKRQSAGYKAQKSETFTREDVNKFLLEAQDEEFLMIKVALIMGITGAVRCDELAKMTVDNIEDKGSILIVTIPDSMTRNQRTFVINGETTFERNVVDIYRKYAVLRPENTDHRRLFIAYNKGKCTAQVVGKNTLAKIPSVIAKFLGKESVNAYTGHCLRRTSATLLVDAGADILNLRLHGGWKSTSVAEGHVNDSIENKRKPTNRIITFAATNNTAIHSTVDSDLLLNTAVSITNATNCNFTININK